jgi:hypothetical protein
MDSVETVFGESRPNWRDWNPYVVVRHGIMSDDVPFQDLSRYILGRFRNAIVDNQKYTWTDSVVLNGARLAKQIFRNNDVPGRPLVLIGHSMGGLVCRVANLLLSQPGLISRNRLIFQNYCDGDGNDFQTLLGLTLDQHAPKAPSLLVTLGTPNSGAMLKAQVSALGDLLGQVAKFKYPSLKDLNTIRLFRLLQYFSTNTPTLTISGSGWNRFKKAPTPVMFWAPHLAASLNLPNDMIVEDRSVDLVQSILPNEVLSSGSTKYLHVRLYRDCTDVIHTTIYDHGKVRDLLVDCMSRC